MFGLGTLINAAAVVAGGIIGLLFGKLFSVKLQKTLNMCNGISVIMIGIAGTLSQMLTKDGDGFGTQKTLLFILSMVLGSILGTVLKLDELVERFAEWLKIKTKSTSDDGFVNAFVISSCTVCIGAMAVIGAINDIIYADISILVAKSIIDLVTVCIMTSSMGKGCIFSAIPIILFQGTVSVLAWLIKPIMTDLALADLSLVGSVLIACVGINLAFDKKIPVINMLPAIIFAVGFSFIPALN